jgi:hypothetical protein
VPAYLIRYPQGERSEDTLVEDQSLTLNFEHGWAVFSDANGFCLAVPCSKGASIERFDDRSDGNRLPP